MASVAPPAAGWLAGADAGWDAAASVETTGCARAAAERSVNVRKGAI